MSGKATQISYDRLDQVVREAIHFRMDCCRHEQLCLQYSHNFSPTVCYDTYITVQNNLLRYSLYADDVVNEYSGNGQGVHCFLAGTAMRSLCHGIHKPYNAVVAISLDWEVGHEVDADCLPTAFGDRQRM